MAAGDATRAGGVSPRALVAAGFALAFVVIGGGVDTVSLFLNAIVVEEGWSHGALSLAVGLGALEAALATPLVGLAVDRFGVRAPMLGGVGALAAGYAVLFAMSEPWHFVAANLLLGAGFAAGAIFPVTVAITLLVRRRTAFALGLAAAGSSAGALLLAPAVQALIEALGWRDAYLTLGAAVVATPLPIVAFVLPRGPLARPEAAAAGALPRLRARELLRWRVGALAAVFVLPHLVTFAVTVHLVPYLTAAGFTAATAALVLGGTVGLSGVGKIGGGLVADLTSPLSILRSALGLLLLALLVLGWSDSYAALGVFALLYGVGFGAYLAILPPLSSRVLGAERFGTLFGSLQLGGMLASAAGPVIAGLLFDATGSYAAAVAFWAGAAAAGLLVALAMGAPQRRPEERAPELVAGVAGPLEEVPR